jgi:SAM-dependent methyltransferase
MLKNLIKSFIPVSLRRIWYALKYKAGVGQGKPAEGDISGTFTTIFRDNYWGSDESISGTGSELGRTQEIRKALRSIIDAHGITSVLDIPCGDFNWMQHTDLSGVRYIGADIVQEIVANNQRHAIDGRYEFRHLDLTSSELPKVDLIFVRDCLPHLSNANIGAAIRNIRRSGAKYLLTTSFPSTLWNYNINNGEFRPINLQGSPFGFPAAERRVLEDHGDEKLDYPDKCMMLWDVAKLPELQLS